MLTLKCCTVHGGREREYSLDILSVTNVRSDEVLVNLYEFPTSMTQEPYMYLY
jgi:hypothetical protein